MIKTFLSVVVVTVVSAGSTEVADLISAARDSERRAAYKKSDRYLSFICKRNCYNVEHKKCAS